MTWIVRFCAAALIVFAPAHAGAQAMLTLEAAVQNALARNPSLRAARAGTAVESARVAEARAGWFPRLSVSESWRRGDQPVFVFSSLLSARRFAAANFAVDALNRPDAIGFFQTNVGVEQVLFDGGRQRSAVTAATLQHQLAEIGTDALASAVVVTVTETFARIVTAQASARALDAALAAAREDAAHAERRRDAGMATDADVLALRAHVSALEHRAIRARGDASVARAELNRLMAAPLDQEYAVVEPAVVDRDAGLTTNLAALLAEAEETRPEVRRAAALERLADAGRTRARAALLPQAAAHAAVDVSGTRIGDRTSAWIVGADVRWNLSLGGADLAQLRAAREAGTRARAEAEDARVAVRVEVVTAVRRLETARAGIAVGRAAVDQARESERIVRDRFEAGMAGVTDILRASSARLDAETERTAALVDAMVSEAMLRRAVGRRP